MLRVRTPEARACFLQAPTAPRFHPPAPSHTSSVITPADVTLKIAAFISEWNEIAHPFAWTPKSFEKILAKVEAAIAAAALTAAAA